MHFGGKFCHTCRDITSPCSTNELILSEAKAKRNSLANSVFPALCQFLVVVSSSDWFIVLLTLVMNGWRDYYYYFLMTLNQKPPYVVQIDICKEMLFRLSFNLTHEKHNFRSCYFLATKTRNYYKIRGTCFDQKPTRL